ncbi:MAG: apolipoprotein N-acyltransferase [Pseudomonadota bacterium]
MNNGSGAETGAARDALARVTDSLQHRWLNRLGAAALGAALVLALPPLNLWLAGPLVWCLVVLNLDRIAAHADRTEWPKWRRALRFAAIGWWFGFGYFVVGLHWIGEAFLVEADKFAWALPIAVTALPGGLALFFAAAFAVGGFGWSRGPERLVLLSLAVGCTELLRGVILTGFPWNPAGLVLGAIPGVGQSAAIIGLEGLGLLAVAICAAPVLFLGRTHDIAAGTGQRPILSPSVMLGGGLVTLAGVMSVWGSARIAETQAPAHAGLQLRIVQPNIPQREKWLPEKRAANFARLLDLTTPTWSRAPGFEPSAAKPELEPAPNAQPTPAPASVSSSVSGALTADAQTSQGSDGQPAATRRIVIWPEAAPPFFLLREQTALQAVARALAPGDVLITGANRATARAVADGAAEWDVFNSVMVLDDQARLRALYDKTHLVPFGEYLPFQATLEAWGIRQLTALPGGFTPGLQRSLLDVPQQPSRASTDVGVKTGLRLIPLICYEVIFARPITKLLPAQRATLNARGGRSRAAIINLTNDAWFGSTIGPHQHLALARMRAIEEGLALVRAANTGISAVFDPMGRIVSILDLGVQGALSTELPKSLPSTPYATHGRTTFALLAVLMGWLIALFVVLRLNRTQH